MNEWERKARFVKINDKVFSRTRYTNFIMEMGLEAKLIDSGYTSPKNFIKERCNREWLAYQVVKRMEDK